MNITLEDMDRANRDHQTYKKEIAQEKKDEHLENKAILRDYLSDCDVYKTSQFFHYFHSEVMQGNKIPKSTLEIIAEILLDTSKARVSKRRAADIYEALRMSKYSKSTRNNLYGIIVGFYDATPNETLEYAYRKAQKIIQKHLKHNVARTTLADIYGGNSDYKKLGSHFYRTDRDYSVKALLAYKDTQINQIKTT